MFSLHPKGKNLIWGHKILIFEKLTNLLEYRYMKNLHLLIFLVIAACGGGGGGKEAPAIAVATATASSSPTASSTSSGDSTSSSTNQPPVYSEPQNNTVSMDENILIIPGLTLTDPDDSLTVTVYSSRGYREELNDVTYNVELGNSDGTTKVISSDLTYTSTDTIKLVSDIQLAQGVKLTLDGTKIFTDCDSCSGNKIQVYNGHLDINNSKLRNIDVRFESNTSTDLEEAGSIEISGSNWIGGELKGGGGICFGGSCSTGTIGSYDIRNNYFQDLDGPMYFWSAVNKFIFSGNSLVNSGGISIGYSSDSLIESPVIKNNFFAHKNENNPVGNIYFDYPNSALSGFIPVYVTLLKSDGSKDLILSSNAFLNSNISAFISVYDTTDSIKSDADYFGITNTLDTPSRYLDDSDNLEYRSVVVTNPATYVSDSQTPSFESPIKYNSDGTFEFLIAPDYEANARELNYTIRYSDGVNPEKEKTIKIVINDVLD